MASTSSSRCSLRLISLSVASVIRHLVDRTSGRESCQQSARPWGLRPVAGHDETVGLRRRPSMDADDYFSIQKLIFTYPQLLDRGEVEAMADLFAHATVHFPAQTPIPANPAAGCRRCAAF